MLVDYITIAVGTILLCEWVESWLNSKLGSEWVIWGNSATEPQRGCDDMSGGSP